MGVKISELSVLTSIDTDDRLIINHNGTTYQGNLNTIIGSYPFNYITEEELFGQHGYLDDYVTKDYLESNYMPYISNLSGYIRECISKEDYLNQDNLFSYLSENNYITESYLDNYVTSNDLENYLNENDYVTESYLSGYYVTLSDLNNYLSDNSYITESYLDNYVTSNDLENYLNENDYVTESYLNENSYITNNDLPGLLFRSGYLSEIYYSDGTVNYEAIYQGISSYFET